MAPQSSAFQHANRRLTAPPLSLVSLARDSVPDELPSHDAIDQAPGATHIASAIADLLVWAAAQRGPEVLRRILVVEPRTRNIGVALRSRGVGAEMTALMHTPLFRDPRIAEGFDKTITDDWAPPPGYGDDVDAPTPEAPTLQDRIGSYDALIVSDLSRTLSPRQAPAALAWLATCLDTQGFLALSEPAHMLNVFQLARDLMASGLELVADPRYIAEDWPRTLMILRRRTVGEAHRHGVVQRILLEQVEQDIPLQRQLITAYQDVFGGDEWGEWAVCTRPGCGRHYSRSQAQALRPEGACVCGWNELAPFHPTEKVLAHLRTDLTPPEVSCAYIRYGDVDATGEERKVGGFAWGYLTNPFNLAQTLLPANAPGATAEAQAELLAALIETTRRVQGRDNPAAIYYHAEIGVVENARNLGLAFYLFERSLRFAYERGARVVMLRTSPRSQAYRAVTGLGMRPIFAYGRLLQGSRGQEALPVRDEAQPVVEDDRVVMWGEIPALLGIFSTHLDSRLPGRIVRGLREAKNESGQL